MNTGKFIATNAALFLSSIFARAQDQKPIPQLPPPDAPAKVRMLDDSLIQQAWQKAVNVDYPLPCENDTAMMTVAEKNAKPVIVIDLGHRYQTAGGLTDKGTINKAAGLAEVDIVDKVGESLASILDEKGYDVVLTREPRQPLGVSRGNYVGSLTVRGLMPLYLAEEIGRPVVLLSLHVDNMRRGGAVYVQNDSRGGSASVSTDLANAIAATYRIGAVATRVNPGDDMYKGRGRFDNRMLRTFETVREGCMKLDGAAALIELGDIKDPNDIAAFRRMMQNPRPAATQIAQGLINFINERWPQPQQIETPAQYASAPGQSIVH